MSPRHQPSTHAPPRQHGIVTLDVALTLVMLAAAVALALAGRDLAGKRELAERLGKELRVIERAVQQAAEAGGSAPGSELEFRAYAGFLPGNAPKRLREEGEDPLGRPYPPQTVGSPAVPHPGSAADLDGFLD